MKKLKKTLAVLLCFSLMVCLTGCGESKDIKEAKECIDTIYSYTNELAKAQVELKSCTDLMRDAELRRDIGLFESIIDGTTKGLMMIYEDLSEKGKEEVEKYVTESCYNNIMDIWSND